MKLEKYIMSLLCIISFISYLFVQPERWVTLVWIFIAFVNINIKLKWK